MQLVSQDNSGSRLAQLRKQELERCANDFWYFARFLKTYDEENQTIRDFPLNFDYLLRTHKSVEDFQKTVVFKDRRVFLTWYGVSRQHWQAKFSGTGLNSSDFFSGSLMTTKKDTAIELARRVSLQNRYLPDWLRDFNPLRVDNQMFLSWDRDARIQAFPLQKEGPQTFGFSESLFDEMSLQVAARSTWNGMMPTLGAKGKLLAIATPNGKKGVGQFFYEVWSNHKNQFPGLNRLEIYWHEHPEHDADWYRNTISGMDKQGISRNFGHSFLSYDGIPIFGQEFDKLIHVAGQPIEVVEGMPIFIGWDFGYHYPYFVLSQLNHRDQLATLYENPMYDIDFDEYCMECRSFTDKILNRKKFEIVHGVDPSGFFANRQRGQSGAISDVAAIKKIWGDKGQQVTVQRGLKEISAAKYESPRLKSVRARLKPRKDGRPGAIFSPRCEMLIEGFDGGYVYANGDTEMPDKNEFSHGQDAYQYISTTVDKLFRNTKKPDTLQSRSRIGFRTGM